jgi:hypothetical protein
VAEGLSASEVGKELSEHSKHAGVHAHEGRQHRLVSATEAALLAAVTLIAAWSGYSAAKWGTESSLDLAKASATRAKANRAFQQSLTFRVADAVALNAWLAARSTGDENAMRLTRKRFLPELQVAFNAWIRTHPFTNLNAPRGPQVMPQYKAPGASEAAVLDHEADAVYAEGQHAAETADNYIRATVILASVLFLVGISTHFPRLPVRLGLITVASALVVVAVIEILGLPGPPGS